jgi:hypothetical protein
MPRALRPLFYTGCLWTQEPEGRTGDQDDDRDEDGETQAKEGLRLDVVAAGLSRHRDTSLRMRFRDVARASLPASAAVHRTIATPQHRTIR